MDRLTQKLANALRKAREAASYGPTGEIDLPGVGLKWMEEAHEALADYNRALEQLPPNTFPDSGSGLYMIQNPDGSNVLAHRETVDLLMAFALPQFPMTGKSLMVEGTNRANAGKLWIVTPVDSFTDSVRRLQCEPEPMWGPAA